MPLSTGSAITSFAVSSDATRSVDRRRRWTRFAKLLGADGLAGSQSTFTRRDVLQAVSGPARDGAPIRWVELLADRVLRNEEVVALASEKGEQRYTTRSLLRSERLLLERADEPPTAVEIAAAFLFERLDDDGDRAEIIGVRCG